MTDINQMVNEAIEQMPLKGKSGDDKKAFNLPFEKGKANLNPDTKDDNHDNIKDDNSHASGESASNKLQKSLQKTAK